MQYIISSTDAFDYDIYSLVKAFYPMEQIKIIHEDEEISEDQILEEDNPEAIKTMHLNIVDPKLLISKEERTMEFLWVNEEERPDQKNRIKKALYEFLKIETGKELPWGNLTGIRPTKIPMILLEEGMKESDILVHLENLYQISEKKGMLAIEIAKREQEILSKIDPQNGYSLYIGIPFCPTTCLYCSFTSYPIVKWRSRIKEYLTAMEKEMRETSQIMKGKKLDTVYIGGGTPTTLEADELDQLLSDLKNNFDLDHIQEFTVEAGRADSITQEKLLVLKKHGVDRISINPQTMNEKTLKVIGRQHTIQQVKDAFGLARGMGFSHINMDIILGLPGESNKDVEYTMSEISKLDPESITVHSLAVKRASAMSRWIKDHQDQLQEDGESMMEIAEKWAHQSGLLPYYLYRQKNMTGNLENVGFAKDGLAGIYNILIMEEKQSIVALGAGSISKRVFQNGKIERCDNVKDVDQYLERIDEMIERKRILFESDGKDL